MTALKAKMVTFNRPDGGELQGYLTTPANSESAPA